MLPSTDPKVGSEKHQQLVGVCLTNATNCFCFNTQVLRWEQFWNKAHLKQLIRFVFKLGFTET